MHQVDETLFVQILHAYSARNPMELILDDAYDSCLQGMLSAAGHRAPELQQRFGAKLFVKQRNDGQNVLVAGTKKRNQELIPLSRVLSTLQELAQDADANATQLKQAVPSHNPDHFTSLIGQGKGTWHPRGDSPGILRHGWILMEHGRSSQRQGRLQKVITPGHTIYTHTPDVPAAESSNPQRASLGTKTSQWDSDPGARSVSREPGGRRRSRSRRW